MCSRLKKLCLQIYPSRLLVVFVQVLFLINNVMVENVLDTPKNVTDEAVTIASSPINYSEQNFTNKPIKYSNLSNQQSSKAKLNRTLLNTSSMKLNLTTKSNDSTNELYQTIKLTTENIESATLNFASAINRQSDIDKNTVNYTPQTVISITTPPTKPPESITVETQNAISGGDNLMNGAAVLTFAGLNNVGIESTYTSTSKDQLSTTQLDSNISEESVDVAWTKTAKEQLKNSRYRVVEQADPSFIVSDQGSGRTIVTTESPMTTTEIYLKKRIKTKVHITDVGKSMTTSSVFDGLSNDLETSTSLFLITSTVDHKLSTTDQEFTTTLTNLDKTTNQISIHSQDEKDSLTTTERLTSTLFEIKSLTTEQTTAMTKNIMSDPPITTTKTSKTSKSYHTEDNSAITIGPSEEVTYKASTKMILPYVTTPFSIENRTESTDDSSTTAPEPMKNSNIKNIIVISLSVIGGVALILCAVLQYVIRKRQKNLKTNQRCRPVNSDAYSLDSLSVFNSVRRKAKNLRLSKRSYTNSAFDDTVSPSNPLSLQDLQTFSHNKYGIHDEFKAIPTVSSRIDELPSDCEDKNRYANVIPLPETRVHLKRINNDEKSEYINANYVKGPKDERNYYIASQAPLKNTLNDFWRMIWEENCKVIIQLTDLTESGVEKCAEYLPPSVVLDNVCTFDNFQVTLKGREVKEKYAVSTIHLKNTDTKSWREVTHFWYSWPEIGVPQDETSVIAMLLEARSYLQLPIPQQNEQNALDNRCEDNSVGKTSELINTTEKSRFLHKIQGPLVVHCSPGTSRTGTIICCDIVLREIENSKPKIIDIPKIVFAVRRCRASSVQTKQQYEFIYKVAHMYSSKLNGSSIE